MDKIIFVADLHIDIGETKRLELFAKFLAEKTKNYSIYIMGDLFNFWAGSAQGNLGYVRPFLKKLAFLAKNNQIFFLAGNRDFLFVSFFKKRLKGKVIYDGHIIHHSFRKIILYHGDDLCTGDINYFKMKKLIQSPLFYCISKVMPSNICVKIGKKFRNTSKEAIKKKKTSDLELDDNYMFSILQEQNADVLICGHVHKQEIKTFDSNLISKHVYVLPECQKNKISYLELSEDKFSFKEYE